MLDRKIHAVRIGTQAERAMVEQRMSRMHTVHGDGKRVEAHRMIASRHPYAKLAVEVALLDVALLASRCVEDMTAMLGCIGRLNECQWNIPQHRARTRKR